MPVVNGRLTKSLQESQGDYPRGYHRGAGDLTEVERKLIAANVKYGVNIFGIIGTMVLWNYELDMPPLYAGVPTCGLSVVSGVDATGPHDVSEALSIAMVPTVAGVAAVSQPLAVDGGVAHKQTGPVDTDQTAETNSAAASDMDLLPAAGLAVGDGFYYGYTSQFDWIAINQGTAGVGTWTTAFKYWNGAWVALTTFNDDITSGNLKNTGIRRAQWNRPGDWVTTTIAALGPYYWIKFEMTAYTSITTQPKGTQAWVGVW